MTSGPCYALCGPPAKQIISIRPSLLSYYRSPSHGPLVGPGYQELIKYMKKYYDPILIYSNQARYAVASFKARD